MRMLKCLRYVKYERHQYHTKLKHGIDLAIHDSTALEVPC